MSSRSPATCSSPTHAGGRAQMLAVNWFHFLLNLILAGFFLRFLQLKLAGTDMGKALAFVY
jgi:hypothetical protein